MTSAEDFEALRRDPDPIRRGVRATKLLTLYQQRATELARLRREAIEEAYRQGGMTYTEIAEKFGITKGRITQIRHTAPGPERALFGVGPVGVWAPIRRLPERPLPVIAAEDQLTVDLLRELLAGLQFSVTTGHVTDDQEHEPAGDTVLVCGPASAPVAARLIDTDPILSMTRHTDKRWSIDATDGPSWTSAIPDSRREEYAYLARRTRPDGSVLVHIAGLHAIGSLGAAHWLREHATELWRDLGDTDYSAVIGCRFRGTTITRTWTALEPRRHDH